MPLESYRPTSQHLDSDTRIDIAATAIKHMYSRGTFYISTINDIAALFDISVRGSDAYNALSALHCINFASMPASLQKKIPLLIQECFTRVAIRFDPNTGFVDTTRTLDTSHARTQNPSDTERKSFWSKW